IDRPGWPEVCHHRTRPVTPGAAAVDVYPIPDRRPRPDRLPKTTSPDKRRGRAVPTRRVVARDPARAITDQPLASMGEKEEKMKERIMRRIGRELAGWMLIVLGLLCAGLCVVNLKKPILMPATLGIVALGLLLGGSYFLGSLSLELAGW